jgi:hypothetical protein
VGYKREKWMDVESYISKYEALFRRAEKNKIIYPDDIKGFMVMEGANLSVLQAQFVTVTLSVQTLRWMRLACIQKLKQV